MTVISVPLSPTTESNIGGARPNRARTLGETHTTLEKLSPKLYVFTPPVVCVSPTVLRFRQKFVCQKRIASEKLRFQKSDDDEKSVASPWDALALPPGYAAWDR